jgi:hypothetical protein
MLLKSILKSIRRADADQNFQIRWTLKAVDVGDGDGDVEVVDVQGDDDSEKDVGGEGDWWYLDSEVEDVDRGRLGVGADLWFGGQ